jgi:hypothetical protein
MVLGPFRWLPSHLAPVVLCYPSFLVLEIPFFTLDGVGLLGFLGVRFVLMVRGT